MQAAVAAEMRALVRAAAEPVSPGATVKAQMRRAWERLGRPTFWRVRAAWNGEAGCWSAAAADDFRARAAGRHRQHERQSREEAAALVARLSRLRSAMLAVDPDLYGPEAGALGDALRALGAGGGPQDAGA